jgi:hypothetical protein
MSVCRSLTKFVALLALGFACVALTPRAQAVDGIVWQLDNATVNPRGNWQQLGVRQLLLQWTVVDDIAFVPGTDIAQAPQLPDWQRIGAEPWAQEVIVGLAGRFAEDKARAQVDQLVAQSERLAQVKLPLNVAGWYFPVEVDPSWNDAKRLATLLDRLPRPLWISVYDSRNVGADVTADWLAQWLPNDVGVLFQDGVGVHARTPPVAREYAEALRRRFGEERVRVILEAFRPAVGGGFRSATRDELQPQIDAFKDYFTYLFDGPHYVDDKLVEELAGRP